jgi:hypothetical protein
MRTFDPNVPNRIANHPAVVRNLEWNPEDHPETDGWLLLGPQVENRDHYVFLVDPTERLCLIFEWSAPGVWQMHSMSMPDFRGKAMMRAAKALIHEMFVEVGADMLWGQTPLQNRAARMFNRLVGAISCGFGRHHIAGDVEYFRNSRARWIADHGPRESDDG